MLGFSHWKLSSGQTCFKVSNRAARDATLGSSDKATVTRAVQDPVGGVKVRDGI
jgi:hypothetical protein